MITPRHSSRPPYSGAARAGRAIAIAVLVALTLTMAPMARAADGASGDLPNPVLRDVPEVHQLAAALRGQRAAQMNLPVVAKKSAEKPALKYRPLGDGAKSAKLSEANEILSSTVSVLDFRDAELQDILRLIAAKSRLNIIMNPQGVKGKVTLHLENVKLGTALDNILKINGLAYVVEADANIVRIVPASTVGIEEVETKTEIIQVNWVDATALAATLQTFISNNGKIIANNETNSLIVTDTPPALATIRTLVKEIDIPERQVMVEARLVDMQEGAVRSLGASWDMWRNDSSGNSMYTLDTLGLLNSRTYYGSTGSNTVSESVSQEIIGEVWDETLGTFIPGVVGERTTTNNSGNTALAPAIDLMRSNVALDNGGRGLDWVFGDVVSIFGQTFNLAMRIQALETRDLVETLANPRIMTLNNIEAKIQIIRRIPYTEAVTGVSGATTNEVEFEDAGVDIGVTPIITPNGYVRMAIDTKQMIFRGRASSGDLTPPIIDLRNATTNVICQSADTVMLGGLREIRLSEQSEGIPWFNQIPVLGWLFKNRTNDQSKTDLYLFVTPTIIEDFELTSDEKGKYDRIDVKWHLPDYYFDDVKTQSDQD